MQCAKDKHFAICLGYSQDMLRICNMLRICERLTKSLFAVQCKGLRRRPAWGSKNKKVFNVHPLTISSSPSATFSMTFVFHPTSITGAQSPTWYWEIAFGGPGATRTTECNLSKFSIFWCHQVHWRVTTWWLRHRAMAHAWVPTENPGIICIDSSKGHQRWKQRFKRAFSVLPDNSQK